MRPRFLLPCCLILFACAGSPPSSELGKLYRDNLEDAGGGSASALAETESRRAGRVFRVRELAAQGPIESIEDRLFAASILLDSPEMRDLTLAEDLALSAALDGDDRGFPLAAEAIDRQCLTLGQPQRYGTQYVWSPQDETWSLYPTDPATSDAERRSMGVPTLAEARALAAELDAR